MAELKPADDPGAPPPPRHPLQAWRRAHVALRIGVIYLAARLVTWVFFIVGAAVSGSGATFADLALRWDAQWYWLIAENGYPAVLPVTESGQVAQNPWAFMPVYAYLAEWVGLPLGGWWAGAVVVSLVAGYFACLVLFRLLRTRLDDTAATWAVLFFACGPVAALFQVGYAESLFLLGLFVALYCVMARRYAWLYLLIPLMGYTRPGILAFALFLALHGIHRWFTRRRESLPVADIVNITVLGLLAVVVGFSWQVIAGIVTGDAGAYLATEMAWRRIWVGEEGTAQEFVPFEGFVQGAAFWFTQWGLGEVAGYVVLATLILGTAVVLLFEPHVKRLGPDVRLWSASYLVYLLLVFFPQSSIFRLLVPLSPLWGAVAAPRATGWRVGVLVACLAGQWWWIYNMYALGNTFWQVP